MKKESVQNLLTIFINWTKIGTKVSNDIRKAAKCAERFREADIMIGLPAGIFRAWLFTEWKETIFNKKLIRIFAAE